jgi:RHH-type transcriptional regulator, proline utilization regulon repressor / proline dehydrogenase / delta 1-pyrroline-5-carboxylate dehydrogenase
MTGQKIIPLFVAPYAPADEDLAATLLADPPRDADAESRIDARARRWVEAIRAKAISSMPIRCRPKRAWR